MIARQGGFAISRCRHHFGSGGGGLRYTSNVPRANLDWITYAGKKGRSFRAAYTVASEYMLAREVPEAKDSARHLLSEVAGTGYRLSDFHRAMGMDMDMNIDIEEVLPPITSTALPSPRSSYINEMQMERLGQHCDNRVRRMPVQYIVGNWDFYGLVLQCKQPILIPRPETEELVEMLLQKQTGYQEGVLPIGARVLDIGVGTGAIGLALLAERRDLSCVGLDVHPVAVELATSNAAANAQTIKDVHKRYTCIHQSLEDYATSGVGDGTFDILVSNPPYIPSDEMETLAPEVVKYEDGGALHGGLDGLDIVRQIVKHAVRLLKPVGTGPGEVWIEVARQHPAQIQAWMQDRSQYQGEQLEFVESINDLSGHPRFVRLRLRAV